MKRTLLFVYNADSGFFNTLSDIAHKIFSPQTYSCNLCAITYDAIGIRQEWRSFLNTLERPLEFLHRDEFRKLYPGEEVDLPALFAKEGEKLSLLADAAEINRCGSIEDLKRLILAKLN